MSIYNIKFLIVVYLLSFTSFGSCPSNSDIKKKLKVLVLSSKNTPIKNVQVSLRPENANSQIGSYDSSQYLIPFVEHKLEEQLTKFTDSNGKACFDLKNKIYPLKLFIRSFGYQEETSIIKKDLSNLVVKLMDEMEPIKLNEQKPASFWLSAIKFRSDEEGKIFRVQCGFCHQQMTSVIRMNKDVSLWSDIINRMVSYGSRIPSDFSNDLPELIVNEIKRLEANPKLISSYPKGTEKLQDIKISEWPVGDSFSQMHDVLVSRSGKVYVADNIQDRLYEFNPSNSKVVLYKIPHMQDDENGGLIKSRLQFFPKHESTSNAHSLAESKIDGHIFITPSAQQRLIEFDPSTKKFQIHEMKEGFYPHTIRIDSKDNVWFTLALSNQIAKFDRKNNQFKCFDLPSRSIKEKFLTKNIKWVFKIMNAGVPLYKWLYRDEKSMGVPLPYGIDITPDQKVWFARLHTNEIGYIDQQDESIHMINTPFDNPRRLRTDISGNIWISSFGDSLISKYDPFKKQFVNYPLPLPRGVIDTPYSLNFDKKRNWVWVNGNQSNALFALDVSKKLWHTFPLPRKISFTRDIDFDEDGNAYTSNSNFPSWQIEDQQPTLIRVSL